MGLSAWGARWGNSWGSAWGGSSIDEPPPIQPGAFAPLDHGTTPIPASPRKKRRTRQRREMELMFFGR